MRSVTRAVMLIGMITALVAGGCSDGADPQRDRSVSLEQLAVSELAPVDGVVDVRASQEPATDDALLDRSDPDRWHLYVQVTLEDAVSTAQAQAAAEELRAFMDTYHSGPRWTAHVELGPGAASLEVWPELRTSPSADVADVLALRDLAGVQRAATAGGTFSLEVGSASSLPALMPRLRELPAWSAGGSVHAEEGRVRIMDVPDLVTDEQLQAVIAISLAHPAADVEISAAAQGAQVPVLYLNRLSEAEAANVVATLTDPALAHTADDGYQLDFALRSDAGDQTGTVGVPG
ncbi:hypothetical protein [Aeromicrobium sp.]|uniref:hypothetical protein n=1 Tax=Aeromicrobium sp. TaxID=1871063 RepID=UPI0025B8A710|nr:hypothetical protein [Aeromicrobium sp.]MCK5890953.1 hypothetical protein [Aeromicrobium sp.]